MLLYFSSPEVSFDAIIGVFESGNFRYLFKDVNGDDIMLWFLFLKKNCSLNDIKLSLRYLKKFYIQVRTLIDWKINSKDVRCIRENFLFLFDSLKKFQIDPFIDTISNFSLYVNWNAKKRTNVCNNVNLFQIGFSYNCITATTTEHWWRCTQYGLKQMIRKIFLNK
jgi:hypothetical protein